MTNAVTQQLLALRAALESALHQVDAALLILCPEAKQEEGECRHPPEKRKNISSMGIPRWQCGICGYIHEGKGG